MGANAHHRRLDHPVVASRHVCIAVHGAGMCICPFRCSCQEKPLALLDRIIKASSNPGDMMLGPFCGCATALVAAERLGRQWTGIDLSLLATKLVKERIFQDNPPWGGTTERMETPIRTDVKKLPHYREEAHRLYGEQEGICAGCHTHFPFQVMDVDHILPKSRDGTDHPITCNCCVPVATAAKGTRPWRSGRQHSVQVCSSFFGEG